MKFDMTIVTNNPLVYRAEYENVEKVFVDSISVEGVFFAVRDMIHKGHRLLSHPLSGSLKPNENPYKSVVVSRKSHGIEFDHLIMIEKGIETTYKFLRGKSLPTYKSVIKDDFMMVDKLIVESGLKNNGGA